MIHYFSFYHTISTHSRQNQTHPSTFHPPKTLQQPQKQNLSPVSKKKNPIHSLNHFTTTLHLKHTLLHLHLLCLVTTLTLAKNPSSLSVSLSLTLTRINRSRPRKASRRSLRVVYARFARARRILPDALPWRPERERERVQAPCVAVWVRRERARG